MLRLNPAWGDLRAVDRDFRPWQIDAPGNRLLTRSRQDNEKGVDDD